MNLETVTDSLLKRVRGMSFGPPVTHVYNPLVYAGSAYRTYLRKYGSPPKEVVLLGMNPGPFGMAQTGVPFGDVAMVRDWLGIEEKVRRPECEHPRRPVQGFGCRRSEVSGTRLWGWARDTFGTAGRFFARFFVANYCPLVFLEAGGRNRTPDKLPVGERLPLIEACDRALVKTIEVLGPAVVVGVGRFAAQRAEAALAGMDVRVACILHPSPASPAANRGWAETVTVQLAQAGVRLPETRPSRPARR